MLQHTYRFWSRVSYQRAMWQHGASVILSELAAADFNLFARLKSAVKWWCSCGATDIIKNATEELKRLSKNGFRECFQYLYSRWQKFIVDQGDYFEGNVAYMIVHFFFVFLRNTMIPGIFWSYHVKEINRAISLLNKRDVPKESY